MIGRDSREDIDGYGIWPWIAGVGLALALIFILHYFATPIS
ncbi:dihydroxy-acid dehydratase [Psychromarinibacter sp. C21-152]|uniref:Dihydroxy-acid dehydratase n=1 Tax=Psychromarinibacter sediminicola TaxID=3033385 RepID=A0AAE3NVZ4_9RHOB|nr:dihydroxy-acid dehydratase [Psychromarinibacter sediminicola]MDF0601965.1 dihydroxy-acid dehydratase [Psychromarinibacter sediminicola]